MKIIANQPKKGSSFKKCFRVAIWILVDILDFLENPTWPAMNIEYISMAPAGILMIMMTEVLTAHLWYGEEGAFFDTNVPIEMLKPITLY